MIIELALFVAVVAVLGGAIVSMVGRPIGLRTHDQNGWSSKI